MQRPLPVFESRLGVQRYQVSFSPVDSHQGPTYARLGRPFVISRLRWLLSRIQLAGSPSLEKVLGRRLISKIIFNRQCDENGPMAATVAIHVHNHSGRTVGVGKVREVSVTPRGSGLRCSALHRSCV